MSEFVKEGHCPRLEFVEIGVSAIQGIGGGLREEGVAYGDCRPFGVCIWFVAWLDRLLTFGITVGANVVDSDCIAVIATQAYEFAKEIVVVLGGVVFALVLGRNE